MRVDLMTYGAEPPENRATSRARQPQTRPESESAGVDRARFSFDQARVQSLQAQALKQPEIRQEKVARLGKLVRNGHYAVSADEIANSMLAEVAGTGSARE